MGNADKCCFLCKHTEIILQHGLKDSHYLLFHFVGNKKYTSFDRCNHVSDLGIANDNTKKQNKTKTKH